ncbi:MAG: hypothetical protein MUF03_05805 [Rubrivivax sp.]|nr:hypothetical protein [Rubrivivax sp.]
MHAHPTLRPAALVLAAACVPPAEAQSPPAPPQRIANWGERYTQGVMLDMEYDPAPPITGGTPERTGRLVTWMMQAMYGAGLDPLIERLEKAQGR